MTSRPSNHVWVGVA